MTFLPAILRASLFAALLVSTSIADAQLFRRTWGQCNCSMCQSIRAGTWYSPRSIQKIEAVSFPSPSKSQAPSPKQVILLALEIAELKPHDLLLDVGSGDGRVVEIAVRDFGCKSIGIEKDVKLAEQSSVRLRGVLPYDANWNIVTGDATKYNLSRATVAYMYLYPETIKKVVPLLTGCTRIISFQHPIPGYANREYATEWGPIYIVDADGVVAKAAVKTTIQKTLIATEAKVAPPPKKVTTRPRTAVTTCRT
jgi:hypothetical protein